MKKQKILRMRSTSFESLKGKLLLFFYGGLLVIVMPIGIWKSCNDEEHLKTRGKLIEAVVTNVYGVNNNKISYNYNYDNKSYNKVIDAPSDHKKSIGDKIEIICDTLNPENAMIIWKK